MQACWYSSVSRGSNVRRKFTLPVWPPVAMMTPLRASMLTAVPSSRHNAENLAGPTSFPDNAFHFVPQQDFRALLPRRDFELPDQPGAVAAAARRNELA